MKKLLAFLLVFCMIFTLVSCDLSSFIEDDPSVDEKDGEKDGEKDDEKKGEHTYLDFTDEEKEIFEEYVGKVIPFIPCDEYYVEGYYDVDDYENGINFYTVGNTSDEFEKYLDAFADYEHVSEGEDDKGHSWDRFTDGDIIIDISFYREGKKHYVDVFVWKAESSGGDTGDYTYTDFTDEEKALLEERFGFVIPFIPNNQYYLEEYAYDNEDGINFYTLGNTEEEFLEYLELFDSFTYDGEEVDDYGDTWYFYSSGDFFIDVAYYEGDDGYYVDVYVYTLTDDSGDNGDNGDTGDYTYTDFTDEEKALFDQYFGFVIPFIPNNEYCIEEFIEENYEGINLYTLGNTEEEFLEYLELFDSFAYDGEEVDEYGDTWYFYSSDDVMIDLAYYYYDDFGCYIVDVYVCVYAETGSGDGNGNTGDNGGPGDGESTEDAWRESYETITVKEAIDICDATGSVKSDRHYLIGTVVSIADNYYGQMIIQDATGALLVYGTYGADGSDRYGDLSEKPKEGDVVLFYGDFMTYNGTREMYSGWIIDFYTPGEDTGSGDNGDGGSTGDYTYTDFTDEEKALLEEHFGFVIPFIPNNEYCIEEYTYENEDGVNFYTIGNTEAEFLEYLELFDSFTYDGNEVDEYGDMCYFYSLGDVMIDLTYYYYDDFGCYIVDVYVYVYVETDSGDDNGNTGDNGGAGGGSSSNSNVITNAGAGLPEGTDGVFEIDFTKSDKVKNVTDQGYYLDGCPTTGSPAVLVIPVEFSDSLASSKGYTTDALKQAFLEGGEADYYSVYDYYYTSSYGQLELDITVLDTWFRPAQNSSYYYNATYDYYGDTISIGDQLIIDEALEYLEGIMDLSQFDSDGNGIIDSIVLVNTLDIGEEDFYWAYRYWNVYTDSDGYYYEYDGVSANDYIWASYQFLLESYDEKGNVVYEDGTMNTYTFIHEFGHVLGADDYYDTAYVNVDDNSPLAGCDIMDAMTGDHNAYTKFNFGWITSSRLVVTDGSITLTLEDFSKSGDTIIIANNWDESLGVYQEYYVLMYYTNTGLNGGDAGYFQRDGVVVYHVNASLFSEEYGGEIYYDVYNNNTDGSDYYGTEDNLIEYVKSAEDTFTYAVGDTLPSVTDDNGEELSYTFVVDSLTEEFATITFTAK